MLSAQSLRGEARMEIMMIDTKAIEELDTSKGVVMKNSKLKDLSIRH